ncbi:MAG: MATE family efflux transporter [Agriterribacter sp.]
MAQSRDSRKKATLWNYLFLNVGFLIAVVNGILIVPLYLHFINSSVYGAWLATGNILNWITMVDPGVSGVMLQRVAHAKGKGNKQEIGLTITSGIAISLILFALAVIIGYSISFFIADIAKINDAYKTDIITAFRIAIWGTAFSLLANTFTNIILAYQKTKIHGMFLNGINIAGIVVNIILLVGGFGVFSLAYANLFRGGATLAYAVLVSRYLIKKDEVGLKFETKYFKSFSKIFTYTFSSRLFDTLASNIDLILVSRYLGSHYVTILDLCRRPIKIVSGLANNITISMLPALSHLFGSGDKQTIKAVAFRIWTVILWTSCFIVSGFILFNNSLINIWVGNDLWIGTRDNIIMCVSFLLLAIGYNLSNITYSMGDIKNNSLINMVRNATYLILLYLLAKTMGITGVLLAFGVPLFILLYYYPKKVYEIALFTQADVKSILKETLVIAVITISCAVLSSVVNIRLNFGWLAVFGIIYAVLFFSALFIFSNRFRQEVIQLKKSISPKVRQLNIIR